MDEKYLEQRAGIEQFFISENIVDGTKKIGISPSGNFQIKIQQYSTGRNTWNYSRGIVSEVTTNKIIADIKRNYGHFWYAWVEHPNGYEYLLCGEDYQGYSVLNLSTSKYLVYFPDEGYKGAGFCWTAVYPSPDNLVLAVEGCYWACPYELVLVDFKDPETLPYPELTRCDNLEKCDGWADNKTFVLDREVEYRKSDGKAYALLTKAEQNELDKDISRVGYRKETVSLQKPEAARNE